VPVKAEKIKAVRELIHPHTVKTIALHIGIKPSSLAAKLNQWATLFEDELVEIEKAVKDLKGKE
jgi:hypothetical protein